MMIAVKERAVRRHVVEHAIQYNAHAQLIGMLDQVIEILLRAKVGIDLVVILRVIGMVGTCIEDRIKVKRVDTQRFQVISIPDRLG